MRFMIASYQCVAHAPDGRPVENLHALDFIESPSAEDAIEMFKEDNLWSFQAGFTEFFCIQLSDHQFIRFSSEPS